MTKIWLSGPPWGPRRARCCIKEEPVRKFSHPYIICWKNMICIFTANNDHACIFVPGHWLEVNVSMSDAYVGALA